MSTLIFPFQLFDKYGLLPDRCPLTDSKMIKASGESFLDIVYSVSCVLLQDMTFKTYLAKNNGVHIPSSVSLCEVELPELGLFKAHMFVRYLTNKVDLNIWQPSLGLITK